MNKGNMTPQAQLNAPTGPTCADPLLHCNLRPWRTYSQHAHALNIPLRTAQPKGPVDLVIPSRAITPFASLSLNAMGPQDQLSTIRPPPQYVSHTHPEIKLECSSEQDHHAVVHNSPYLPPVASKRNFPVLASRKTYGLEATPTKPQGK
ncbi:hypothetical protein DFH28DRAFT_928081 [Melampsora americana]|nr:hypothetical protein DFH28DRAFT_928081 [Melampsora americana]